jgi:hypothetical protein
MEQTPLTNKPDISMAVLGDLLDAPNKLAVAVSSKMSKC